MEQIKKLTVLVICFGLGTIFANLPSVYATEPAKVAILPMKIHSPEKMDYLKAGLMDMLTSHIGGEQDVEVLDRKAVEKAFKRSKKDLNRTTAKALADDLGADYIVYSSLTLFGAGGSIDFKVFPRDPARTPVKIHEILDSKNNLIPKFSQVVDEVNKQVFAARPSAAKVEPTPVPVPVPVMVQPTDKKMAAIDQQVKGAPSPQKPPISTAPLAGVALGIMLRPGINQELNHALVSMDVGNVFGDDKQALAAISNGKVFIYKYSAKGLQSVAEFPGAKGDHFVWVSLADLNRNGRDEIFVTNVKRGRGLRERRASFVLEWDGKRLAKLSKDLDYYLRVTKAPGKPTKLLGQKGTEHEAFLPEIYELGWKGTTLGVVRTLSPPKSVNLYNSSTGDIIGEGGTQTVLVNFKGHLSLLDGFGRTLWKSTDSFASSENYFDIAIPLDKIPDPMDEEGYRFTPTQIGNPDTKRVYLYSPILLTDLDGDHKLELVLTHNFAGLAQITGSRQYSKGEVLSLSWGGAGMLENWKTEEIKGSITSLQVSDLDGDGTQELLICVLESTKETSLLHGNRSVIMSYLLKHR